MPLNAFHQAIISRELYPCFKSLREANTLAAFHQELEGVQDALIQKVKSDHPYYHLSEVVHFDESNIQYSVDDKSKGISLLDTMLKWTQEVKDVNDEVKKSHTEELKKANDIKRQELINNLRSMREAMKEFPAKILIIRLFEAGSITQSEIQDLMDKYIRKEILNISKALSKEIPVLSGCEVGEQPNSRPVTKTGSRSFDFDPNSNLMSAYKKELEGVEPSSPSPR